MPINDALLTIGAQAMANAATYGSLHTAQPDATGSNASSAARVALTWDTAANGDMLLTVDAAFTGGTAGGACTHLGLWSASTGGTFYGYFALTGDQVFDGSGNYTVGSITVSGSSSG